MIERDNNTPLRISSTGATGLAHSLLPANIASSYVCGISALKGIDVSYFPPSTPTPPLRPVHLQRTTRPLEFQESGRITIALIQGPSMCVEFEPHRHMMRAERDSSVGNQATLAKASVAGKHTSIVTNDSQILDVVQKYTEKP